MDVKRSICYNESGQCAQNILINLDLKVNTKFGSWGVYIWSFKEIDNLTLDSLLEILHPHSQSVAWNGIFMIHNCLTQ